MLTARPARPHRPRGSPGRSSGKPGMPSAEVCIMGPHAGGRMDPGALPGVFSTTACPENSVAYSSSVTQEGCWGGRH